MRYKEDIPVIGSKGIWYCRALVVVVALLAGFLGAPKGLMAQSIGSGLESTETVNAIGPAMGLDTLWADDNITCGGVSVTCHRWFMNNNMAGNVPVAAWPCYLETTPGWIVVGASSSPYGEIALPNSTLNNAFLQQSSSSHPFWSVYALPSATADDAVLNTNSTGALSFNTALTLGLPGASVGSIIFGNATSGTVTLQPATGALGTVTLSAPAITGTLAVTSDAVNYSTGTYQYASSTAVTPTAGEFTGITGSALVSSANEAEVAAPVARAGTAVEMVLFTQGTITSTNTITFTLRINGTTEAGTACMISMSSNPTTCTFSQAWPTGAKLDYLVGVSGTAPTAVYFVSLAYN